jgi:hypothetical protein
VKIAKDESDERTEIAWRLGPPPELCTRGSGVIEHTIDLVVARRMKRQGMRAAAPTT